MNRGYRNTTDDDTALLTGVPRVHGPDHSFLSVLKDIPLVLGRQSISIMSSRSAHRISTLPLRPSGRMMAERSPKRDT